MDADVDLRAVFDKHDVAVDRFEPVPVEWLPLVDEALTRLVASGWQRRHVRQVKEKFGALRIYVDSDGEPAHFIEWASLVMAEVRERSAGNPAVCAAQDFLRRDFVEDP